MTTTNDKTFAITVFDGFSTDGKICTKDRVFGIPKNVVERDRFITEFRVCAYVGFLNSAVRAYDSACAKLAKDETDENVHVDLAYWRTAAEYYRKQCETITNGETLTPDRFSACITWAVFPQCRRATNGDLLHPSGALDCYTVLEDFENGKCDRKSLKTALNVFADKCFKSADSTIFKTFSCRANDEMTDAIIHSFRGTVYKYRDRGIDKKGLTRENVIANIMLAYLAHTFKFDPVPKKHKKQIIEF